MRKKLLCFVLTIIMSVAALTGCTFFEHNYEKDYMQIVATIAPITETKKNHSDFNWPLVEIYKYQLINALNNNAESLISEQGMTLQEATEYVLEQLIYRELILIEAERMKHFGEIDWRDGSNGDYTDTNYVKRLTYQTIDSQIQQYKNAILTEYDETAPEYSQNEESTEPTYPLQPTIPFEGEDEVYPEAEWDLYDENNRVLWPGYFGNEDTMSLGREALERFVAMLKKSVEDDFRLSKSDFEKFKEDDEKIDNIRKTKGIEYVYPELANLHYIYVYIGESSYETALIERLQDAITKSVNVTEEEILSKYNSYVDTQKLNFNANVSNYNTAIKDGSTLVLYTPTSKYFYVKHILLPFSDKQKADLESFKARPTTTNAQYLEYRDRLVNDIVVYPHLNGEDDRSRPMTVSTVFEQVKSQVAQKRSSIKEAERRFTDFIYLYNTDPGIFGNDKGYVVERELEEGETETYMQEFSDAARELYNNYQPGDVLDTFAVTDYGVHIMYFASKTSSGEVKALYDYETPGEYKTFRDIIKDEVKTAKEGEVFTLWQDERISYYKNVRGDSVIKTFDKRFKDLYETK